MPATVVVTSRRNTQVAPLARLPPVWVIVLLPGAAEMVAPVQVVLALLLLATTRLAGKLSERLIEFAVIRAEFANV